jgi:nitrite reductase/ring-hydroxylating ferredoxin subunit
VGEIEAEDAAPVGLPMAPAPALVELAPAVPSARNGNGWTTAGSLPQLRADGTALKDIAGEPVLFLRVDGTFYAYRPDCPGCGQSLADGELRAARLRCTGCGRSYAIDRAGRCLDSPEVSLMPLPLLEDEAGMVKVAVA